MSKKDDLDNVDGHELVSVAEFAKRIKRTTSYIFMRIRKRNMPPGTVFKAPDGLKIDFTRWEQTVAAEKARVWRRVI